MDSVMNAILGTIGSIIYPLFSIFFVLIDGLYDMFKSFAGVGNMHYGDGFGILGTDITSKNDGGETSTGIVYYLLQSDLVKNMFISILLLGLFLLIIFSVMAFIKNAYAAKPKTWQEIIGNAFRGLANFVVVPVCCLLGIWGGNILLNAIDGATKSSNASSMSGQLFIAASYNANKIRSQHDLEKFKDANELLKTIEGIKYEAITIQDGQTLNPTDEQFDYVASKIDELYARGLDKGGVFTGHSIYSVTDVSEYYMIWNINYIVLIAGGLFMCYVMLSLTYAMIRRIFIILMLFIISPAVNSYYPLDEGKSAGSWKSEFVKQVTSAYGAIAGMNLFFSILPLVNKIKLDGAGGEVLNALGITELIITICGLLIVKEFISMISNFFGLENAYDKGTSLRSGVKSIQKKAAGVTKGVAGAFARAAGAGAAGGKRSFFASLGGSVRDATVGKALEGLGINTKDIKKNYKDGKEEKHKSLNDESKEANAKGSFNELTGEKGTKLESKDGSAVYTVGDKEFYDYIKAQEYANKKGILSIGRSTEMSYEQRKNSLTAGDKKLDDAGVAELLSYAKGDKGLEKKIAEDLAPILSGQNRSKAGFGHAYKHYDADMVLEDRDKYNAGQRAKTREKEAAGAYYDTKKKREEAYESLEALKVGVEIDENTGLAKTASRAQLSQAQFNVEQAQMDYDRISRRRNVSAEAKKEALGKLEAAKLEVSTLQNKNDAAEQYNQAKQIAEAMDEKLKGVAQTWEQAAKDAAETQKGAVKEAYAEVAEGIKSALTENATDMKKAAEAIESTADKYKKIIEDARKK
ncbi:MAG: hypothetical protein IKC49_00425 [Clostridia bacterium]|nr:hypothetical protein [Clostridia bacterium]